MIRGEKSTNQRKTDSRVALGAHFELTLRPPSATLCKIASYRLHALSHKELYTMPSAHDFSAASISGQDTSLDQFKGKTLLVVNVASACGLTPQYEGLQALHDQYAERGLAVLGFPCNQFGAQEPGSEEEIQQFCSSRYGVEFALFSKIEVNGDGRHPLYQFLIGDGEDISWNFEKFLVDGDGQIIARFSPRTAPDDPELVGAIEQALG
jgi:glutathione peroxidase